MHDQDFTIHTSKNIKSSLDIIRRQDHAPKGIITSLEKKFKKELETHYGSLINQNDISDIVKRKELRNKKQEIALDKARLKMLRLKEKIRMIQLIKTNHSFFNKIRGQMESDNISDTIDNDSEKFENVIIKKFDINY